MNSRELEVFKIGMQGLITIIILSFCIFKLSGFSGDRRVNESLYSSILSGIMGWWMPSPTQGGRKDGISVDTESTTIVNNQNDQK